MAEEMKDRVIEEFCKKYGTVCSDVYGEDLLSTDPDSRHGDIACYFAPGRINLIGEHTDYNGGHVFPCALTFGTYVAVRKRDDDVLNLASVNFPDDGVVISHIRTLAPLSDKTWTAYVNGVIWAVLSKISAAGAPYITGMDIMIGGDVPAGAGLSSSASLEVAVGYMLSDQFGLGLTNEEIALLGQKAENDYVGVNCGIMDQFASAMGKKDHAIFLDTNTLEYEYVPLALDGCSIIITNTNKPHSLNDSAYNDRRCECNEALAEINSYIKAKAGGCGSPAGTDHASAGADPTSTDTGSTTGGRQAGGSFRKIKALCSLSEEDFDRVKAGISDPVVIRRARHAVTEDQRTRDAVKVLREGDIKAFGKLMNASHVSLRDDYEVSCPELDLLAETAWEIPGVLGSRMTGGGFGGCTVSIIKDSSVDEYERIAGQKYREAFGYDCTFIKAAAGGGPSRIY